MKRGNIMEKFKFFVKCILWNFITFSSLYGLLLIKTKFLKNGYENYNFGSEIYLIVFLILFWCGILLFYLSNYIRPSNVFEVLYELLLSIIIFITFYVLLLNGMLCNFELLYVSVISLGIIVMKLLIFIYRKIHCIKS